MNYHLLPVAFASATLLATAGCATPQVIEGSASAIASQSGCDGEANSAEPPQERADALHQLGFQHAEEFNNELARYCFEKAWSAHPLPKTAVALGIVTTRLGDPAHALAWYQTATVLDDQPGRQTFKADRRQAIDTSVRRIAEGLDSVELSWGADTTVLRVSVDHHRFAPAPVPSDDEQPTTYLPKVSTDEDPEHPLASPAVFKTTRGERMFTFVVRDRERDAPRTLNLVHDTRESTTLRLEPQGWPARFIFEALPTGASVLVGPKNALSTSGFGQVMRPKSIGGVDLPPGQDVYKTTSHHLEVPAEPGEYVVGLDAPGYKSASESISIRGGEWLQVKLQLEPERWYDSWVLWTIVGVAVLGGASTAVIATQQPPSAGEVEVNFPR